MKEIRCEFRGHFYIEVPDNDLDIVENALGKYISELETCIGDYAAFDEYDWRECNYDV